MQKFTEYVKEHGALIESHNAEKTADRFNQLYTAKLKELGVKSPVELSEFQKEDFFAYLKSVNESELNKDKKQPVKQVEIIDEAAEIKSEKEFTEYAMKVLKKQHGDDFDEEVAKKVIADLSKKVKGDWGEAVGRLNA